MIFSRLNQPRGSLTSKFLIVRCPSVSRALLNGQRGLSGEKNTRSRGVFGRFALNAVRLIGKTYLTASVGVPSPSHTAVPGRVGVPLFSPYSPDLGSDIKNVKKRNVLRATIRKGIEIERERERKIGFARSESCVCLEWNGEGRTKPGNGWGPRSRFGGRFIISRVETARDLKSPPEGPRTTVIRRRYFCVRYSIAYLWPRAISKRTKTLFTTTCMVV